MMQVILMQRIENLGQMGDVVRVKPGFARNYLLPQKKAMRATKENLARFETQRAQLEAENLERRTEAEQVAKALEGMTVTLIRQAGESGQLYGSVTSRDIAEAVTAKGVTIARGQVDLGAVIKVLGLHKVRIRLHPEVSVHITSNVARSEDEAKIQLDSGRVVSAEDLRQAEEAAEAEIDAVVEAVEREEAEAEATEDSESAAEETKQD